MKIQKSNIYLYLYLSIYLKFVYQVQKRKTSIYQNQGIYFFWSYILVSSKPSKTHITMKQ